jgi:type IV secretion system protein VirD4
VRWSTWRSDSPLPWVMFAGVAFIALGVAAGQQADPRLAAGAPWLVTVGVLAVVSAGLVAWSITGGAVVAAGLWLCAGGWFLHSLPAGTDARASWPLMLVAGLLLVSVGVPAVRHGRAGSRGVVQRWTRRDRRNGGVASTWQVLRSASRYAARRKAKVLRPSLRESTAWQRLRSPTTSYATRLARVGVVWVWSTVEDITVRLGGPRTGKSGELAGRIVEAPGAVIATSTRTDLIDLTAAVRHRSGPIYVFNPAGIGGDKYASTIGFDPLSGCREPKTANDRAADMLAAVSSPGKDGGDREFWASQARRVLAALLHAAALGGLSTREVLVWVSAPGERATQNEVQRLLRRSSEQNYEADALQFLTTNDRTRSSITATIMPALSWMTDPTAEATARGGSFDVGQLLEQQGTVYMLGAEDAQTAPLVTALTGHIARQARKIAGRQPSGRLDPALTLALDEAALICPVPLDQWTADMGGRNITLHIAAQSRAQLRQRFGDAGAAAILNNASTLLVFGGTKDPDDLQAYAALTGERDEDVDTYDPAHKVTSTTTRRVPVLSSAQIAQLPHGRVLVIRRDMPVAVGRVQMAWKRRDIRAEARRAEVERLNELTAARWQEFTAWAAAKVLAASEWAAVRPARIAALGRRVREDRAIHRMRARAKPADRDEVDAEVIAFPNRGAGEESAS